MYYNDISISSYHWMFSI